MFRKNALHGFFTNVLLKQEGIDVQGGCNSIVKLLCSAINLVQLNFRYWYLESRK